MPDPATPAPRAPSAITAALAGRCPRCGGGHLFAGPLTLALAPACRTCGLDYTFADPGDGPAVFAILLLGALVLGLAMVAEFRYAVPLWGHVVLWGITTPLVAFALLRVLKSALVVLQHVHGAGQARFAAAVEREPATDRASRTGEASCTEPSDATGRRPAADKPSETRR